MPPFNRRKPQFFITDPLIGMVLWRRIKRIFIKNYNLSSNLKIGNFRLKISICLKMNFIGLKNFMQVPSFRNFLLFHVALDVCEIWPTADPEIFSGRDKFNKNMRGFIKFLRPIRPIFIKNCNWKHFKNWWFWAENGYLVYWL